jgi:hypothetical protein
MDPTHPLFGKTLKLLSEQCGRGKAFVAVAIEDGHKCAKESAGKYYGFSGKKIGNAFLKWAFSEAAVLFLRGNAPAQKYVDRLARKHGKAKAIKILAHRLGRAVYHMLRRGEAFDNERFLATA